MRAIRKFSEYINEGIVKRQQADLQRSESLYSEAMKSKAFLQNIVEVYGITEQNASTVIKLSYDIIMEMIRSRMFAQGYNTSGVGAHEAEVSFLREIGIDDESMAFADQLRYIRNRIIYSGLDTDEEYAGNVYEFMKQLTQKMKI